MEEKSEQKETSEAQSTPERTKRESKPSRYKNIVHLWEFLLEMLADEHCSSLISWSRQNYQEFKLKDKEEVARRWGILKGRRGMNYDKLSRALRYYYRQGIIKKVRSFLHVLILLVPNSTTIQHCPVAFQRMITLHGSNDPQMRKLEPHFIVKQTVPFQRIITLHGLIHGWES